MYIYMYVCMYICIYIYIHVLCTYDVWILLVIQHGPICALCCCLGCGRLIPPGLEGGEAFRVSWHLRSCTWVALLV